MSRRKPIDKTQIRERRNRMLESAAAARLSLTEGVREMRAISGMTQEEFARHRGVSARVIKAIELGQGNPTMATMNRIGQFFGLEVAFVPIMREEKDAAVSLPDGLVATTPGGNVDMSQAEFFHQLIIERKQVTAGMVSLSEILAEMENRVKSVLLRIDAKVDTNEPRLSPVDVEQAMPEAAAAAKRHARRK